MDGTSNRHQGASNLQHPTGLLPRVTEHCRRKVVEDVEGEQPGEEVVDGQEDGVATTCLKVVGSGSWNEFKFKHDRQGRISPHRHQAVRFTPVAVQPTPPVR